MGDLVTQTDVIAFLSQPGSYPGDIKTVEILTTHASIVFLAGDRAYKLKKSVKYSYLDYSTQALRHDACAAELRLNRRTAPQLYLGVLSITRTARGALSMCDEDIGEAVDWVVVMRRFPQSCQFDRLAKRHGLSRDLVIQLTDSIVAFHAAAAPAPQFGGADGIAAVIQINDENLRCSSYFADRVTDINKLRDDSRRIMTRHSPLLDRRRKTGRVRQCHGDLHLGNICLLDGHPVLFDCIEFSELISCIDVLYDLAFLLMDLRHRGHMQACTAVFNRYLDSSGDDDGLPVLSLFMSLRASVRAHVTAAAAEHSSDQTGRVRRVSEARTYLDLAVALLQPAHIRLIAIGGLSGSGKSTIAADLAAECGGAAGARVLRSDVIRKHLFAVNAETTLPEDAYSADVSEKVYREIVARAGQALRAGHSVIIDAVAARPRERESFAALARDLGVPFVGVWLDVSDAVLIRRVSARGKDASDATAAVVRRQLTYDLGPISWHKVDANGAEQEVLDAVRRAVDALPVAAADAS